MDVTVNEELNSVETTNTELIVDVPNPSLSIDITRQKLSADVTVDNNQIVIEGGLIVENVNETFDIETNSIVITLDVIDTASIVTVKESVLDVSVETKTEIVEVLYGPGGGGITIADMNAIYAYAGADSANVVSNNRFFIDLFGWTISGGGTRLERTDPKVPANAPSQYVCKFGGQLARYTGKVLNVVHGERVYTEASVATLAGGAPTISLKAFRYGPTGVKLGEETLDFANSTSAWTRLAGFFETPNDGTTTVEFVLEIAGANNVYDNTKRWYFTNGKLYSTASEEILSASIETINTILYDPIDGLTVQYSLALNNNGRITGIRANATGDETDFAILTDKFYVLDPSDDNNYEQVFEIVDGVVKLRELIANDITTRTINVKDDGLIKVSDSQVIPVDRVEIGKIGSDYGLRVRNAAGDIIFNVDSLGVNTVDAAQIVAGAVGATKTNLAAINSTTGNLNNNTVGVNTIIDNAVTAAKTSLAAINSSTGNLNSNTVDVANIINGAVTAAKTSLAAINSSTGNLNSNTVDVANIINGAVTAAKTSLAAINSSTGNLNSNTVDVANIINGAVTAAKTSLAAINSSTGNLNSNTVDVANIINGAVTAAKTSLAAINSSTGNLNSNTVDVTNIINGAVTAAKTNLAAINNSTGNLNANTVDTAQIINGAISDAAKFSNSIRPIEVVASLPVTGNFDGRTVFLTTNKKIYRYDAVGAAYTASVAAVDLSGQIIGTQITDGSITTPKIAANAVTAGQIAANTITAGQIAANTITAGQIAAGTITAAQIAANTITASKLLITSAENLIADADLRDSSYWTFGGGTTINTADSIVTSNMGLRAAFKSATGNGTLSQTTSAAQTQLILVEPSKVYRFSARFGVSAGFTGVNILYIYWHKQDGAPSAITPLSSIIGTDYRISPAPGIAVQTVDAQITAPSDAYFCRVTPTSQWSTTINNAGIGYQGLVYFNRANSGELIVDGAITAAKIAANTITAGQIAAGTITATQIAAGAITASKLLITSAENLIADADLRDSSYWTFGGGTTINTADSIVTSNMGLRAAFKSATGNGTLSQTTSAAQTQLILVEPSKVYRFSARFGVSAGFTGVNILYIYWHKQDGAPSAITPLSSIIGTDYRGAAAGSITVQTVDAQITAPSDAYFCRVTPTSQWSTTINNAGIGYQGLVYFNRANSGELIVDGAITAAKIAANTITAGQIAAGTITATQIAAGTITAGLIAAGAITASKLLITSAENLIADADLRDSNYWTLLGGTTINTADSIVTSNMGLRVAFKSATGNGTTSQTASQAKSLSIMVESGKVYRASARFAVTAGFTAINIIYIHWFKQDGSASTTPFISVVGTDYRISPAPGIAVQTVDAQVTAPSDAYFCTVTPTSQWSTTINNAGIGYQGLVYFNRANSGELIVDGAITAAKIAANTITAAKIAANTITAGQIAAGTITATQIAAGTITAGLIAAGAITASKLLITNGYNLIADADLQDPSYWSLGTGSINSTDSDVTVNLGARVALKSAIGNGTTSQTSTYMLSGWIAVEPSKKYRVSAITRVTAGFTGISIVSIYCASRTQAFISSQSVVGTDYRSSAAGAATTQTLDGIVTTPSNCYYIRYLASVDWSTTLNNAGNSWFAFNQCNRANSGELIVDGAITAAKIAANTITAGQIAAGTITATQIAANSITASRLTIANFDNLIPNPTSSLQPSSGPESVGLYNAGVEAYVGSWVRRITGSSDSNLFISEYIPCTAGDQFYFEAYAKKFSGTVTSFGVQLLFKSAADGNIGFGSGNVNGNNSTTTYTKVSVSGTAPANTVAVLLYLFVTAGSAFDVYFDALYARRKADANLIVDGTITAAKIAANTITATQIAAGTITATQIAAGTITATQIAAGTITATQIAAGAITASKLLVSNFENLIPNGDLRSGNLDGFSRQTLGSGTATITVPNNPGWPSNYALKFTRTSDSSAENSIVCDSTSFDDTTMTGGIASNLYDEYYFEAIVYASTGITVAVDMVLRTNTTTLANLSPVVGGNTSISGNQLRAVPGTTFMKITGTFVNSTGAGKAYIRLQNLGSTAGNEVYFWNIYLKRKASSQLIVDGAITAAKIAANTITASQIAAGTITATQIAAQSITASRLVLSDTSNYITDPFFLDPSYWSLAGGTIDSADALLPTLGAPKAWKTPVGNGTTSQTGGFLEARTPTVYNQGFAVEPGRLYRYSAKYVVKSGYTGCLQPVVNWIDSSYNLISNSNAVSCDYRASAAGSNITAEISLLFTAPSNAAFVLIYMAYWWSTTLNNAQYALVSNLRFTRAINAELIVDGTITAAKIAANTITAGQIAANTITAAQIATNTIIASRLYIGDSSNILGDINFDDTAYWSIGSGCSYDTSSETTSTLNLKRTAKSISGNGTTSQGSQTVVALASVGSYGFAVEGGQTLRLSAKALYKAGFTGQLVLICNWYKQDRSTLASTSNSQFGGTSYRTVACVSDTVAIIDGKITAPSDACWALFYVWINWSTTLNNAQYALIGQPRVNRSISGELIVNGTITATHIATDAIKSSDWNNTTKQGWLLGSNGSIQGSSIEIWAPGGSPKKIFGASGFGYNGTNFYGLDQIITKVNKASEDGSPDVEIFNGSNWDTWVDLCDIVITATGGQDIDIDVSTDLLIEQLYSSSINLKTAVGTPEFRFRLRRTQGSTVDLKTSEWFRISAPGQIPAALFTVRDTTATAGSATYLLQAQWHKSTYSAGTVSKSVSSIDINGTGTSWLAYIGSSGEFIDIGAHATRANSTLSFTGQPSNGNTFTLNGTVITWVTGTPTGNQIQIGGNLNTTINNAVTFLNGSADAQISKCTYFNVGGTGLLIYYDLVGTAGNSFTTTEATANATFPSGTLTGGTDDSLKVAWEIKVSSVDPNWWPISKLYSRSKLDILTDNNLYNALWLASLTNATYEIRSNTQAVIARLKNYTIRTTEYRNTAVT